MFFYANFPCVCVYIDKEFDKHGEFVWLFGSVGFFSAGCQGIWPNQMVKWSVVSGQPLQQNQMAKPTELNVSAKESDGQFLYAYFPHICIRIDLKNMINIEI